MLSFCIVQMDKNGKIRYKILKQVIPDVYKEIGNEMIDSCKHVGKYPLDCIDCKFICYKSIILIIILLDAEDKCEKTFMFVKCMYNVNPIVSTSR